MKKIQIITSLLIAAMIFSGCREINVETIINKDGSFTRVITITGDSSDVIKMNLPYPVDDSWISTLEKDSSENDKFIQKYTKRFRKSDELNNELYNDDSWRKQLGRNVEIIRDRGFFYSYLTYQETINAANPFQQLDYTDYLSKSDIMWLTGQKIAVNSSDSALIERVENKAEKYLKDSYLLEITSLLEEGIEELDNPMIHKSLVKEYRDSLMTKVDLWSYDSMTEYVDYFSEITGEDEIKRINQLKAKEIEHIDKGIQLLLKVFEMEEYSVSVVTPGLLTNTNSPNVVGNRVQWQVSSMSFLFEDYTMTVESRVVNYWRFVMAGIFLVVLSIVLLVKWK